MIIDGNHVGETVDLLQCVCLDALLPFLLATEVQCLLVHLRGLFPALLQDQDAGDGVPTGDQLAESRLAVVVNVATQTLLDLPQTHHVLVRVHQLVSDLEVAARLSERLQRTQDGEEVLLGERILHVLRTVLLPALVQERPQRCHAVIANLLVVCVLRGRVEIENDLDSRQENVVDDATLRRNEVWRETLQVVERGAPEVVGNERLEDASRGGGALLHWILRVVSPNSPNSDTLGPHVSVAVVGEAEQSHHAEQVLEVAVERRARHAPHVHAVERVAASQRLHVALHQLHLVKHDAPPLQLEEGRRHTGEPGLAPQLSPLRHIHLVVAQEGLVLNEHDVELCQELRVQQQRHAVVDYDSSSPLGSTAARNDPLHEDAAAGVEEIPNSVHAALAVVAGDYVSVRRARLHVFAKLFDPLDADVRGREHERRLAGDANGLRLLLLAVVTHVPVGRHVDRRASTALHSSTMPYNMHPTCWNIRHSEQRISFPRDDRRENSPQIQ